MRPKMSGPFVVHFARAQDEACTDWIPYHSLLLNFPLHLAILFRMFFCKAVLIKVLKFLLLSRIGYLGIVSRSQGFGKLGSELACHRPNLDDTVDAIRVLDGVQNHDFAQTGKPDKLRLRNPEVLADSFEIIGVALQADF